MTDLEAAHRAEVDARVRAFWLHVGAGAPEHRRVAAAEARARWEAAVVRLEAVRVAAAGRLSGEDAA